MDAPSGHAAPPLPDWEYEPGTSEARFRELFGAIPDAVFVHDDQGVILCVNDVAAQLLEWPAVQLLGCTLCDYVSAEDAALFLEQTRRALAGGACRFETACISRTGRRTAVAVHARRFTFEQRVAVMSVARDITAEKELERQRGDFIAMLAHDIRNPLSGVLGYTELLHEMGSLDGEREDLLSRLEANAHALVALVNNYLDLSRIEAGCLSIDLQPLQLNSVLLRVHEQYEGAARRKDVTLALELTDDLPEVAGDALALERVFGNLVQNALKFTPACGCVTLRSGQHQGAVLGMVLDSGPGIAATELRMIFDRYKRTQRRAANAGTGLGLFIAKAFVEAHGGSIVVDTLPGQGCCFIVRLPREASVPSDDNN
jgi:PAS domain S-box-containing protein